MNSPQEQTVGNLFKKTEYIGEQNQLSFFNKYIESVTEKTMDFAQFFL